MEREQATLPFVVPSHLSKLFGLKASVIVEGEELEGEMRVRDIEREREVVPGPNSTCWGDAETAVMGGEERKSTGARSSSTLSMSVSFPPPKLCPSSSSDPHPTANVFPEGHGGFWQKSTRHIGGTQR